MCLPKKQDLSIRLKIREPRFTSTYGDRLAQAEGVYTQSCQACHGADRNGLPELGSSLVRSGVQE